MYIMCFFYLYQDVCMYCMPNLKRKVRSLTTVSLLTYIYIVIDTYVMFVGIWCTLFLEFWKRKEKMTAMKWGMIGFEEEEQDRFCYATVCMCVCMYVCVWMNDYKYMERMYCMYAGMTVMRTECIV